MHVSISIPPISDIAIPFRQPRCVHFFLIQFVVFAAAGIDDREVMPTGSKGGPPREPENGKKRREIEGDEQRT